MIQPSLPLRQQFGCYLRHLLPQSLLLIYACGVQCAPVAIGHRVNALQQTHEEPTLIGKSAG